MGPLSVWFWRLGLGGQAASFTATAARQSKPHVPCPLFFASGGSGQNGGGPERPPRGAHAENPGLAGGARARALLSNVPRVEPGRKQRRALGGASQEQPAARAECGGLWSLAERWTVHHLGSSRSGQEAGDSVPRRADGPTPIPPTLLFHLMLFELFSAALTV